MKKISFLPPDVLKPEFVISALSETTDWGLLASGIPDAHKHTRGAGVVVAVLDTGGPNHLDLNANLLPAINCSGVGNATDKQGHGCISGDDVIWTSETGITTIKNFYDSVFADTVILNPKEESSVKVIDSLNINTLAYFPDKATGYSKIKAVHRLKYEGQVFQIKTRSTQLTLTPWHPIYVVSSRRGKELTVIKKRADELNLNDSICSSQLFEDSLPIIQIPFGQQFNCRFCGHKPNRGNGERNSCRKCNKTKWKADVIHSVELNENLAKWLGLLISDGHIMRSSLSVEFCGNDERLIQEFESLTKTIFGLTCHRYATASETFFRTRVHSKDIVAMLYNSFGLLGGAKSLNVKLPKLIEKSRLSVIGAFVAGLIEGDGHVDGNWRIRVASGSKDFVYALKNLLRMRGMRAFVSNVNNQSGFNKHNDNASEHFHLRVPAHDLIVSQLKFKGEHNTKLNKITELKSESIIEINVFDYNDYMYDLTVHNTHNYIANTLVVSNTHVSGIIAALENGVGVVGVAPEAKILPVKVLDDSGHSGFAQIAAGIRAAIDAKVDVINMSLGAPQTPPDDFYNAIKEAYNAGIIIVAAAGNDAGAVNWPARYDEVIAVSAVNNQGELAEFSSHGEQIDFGAPGVNIYSTYLNNQYAMLNGTSQAAPFIAGVCALLLSWTRKHPNMPQIKNNNDMLVALEKFTDPAGRLTDGKFGFGIPHLTNALNDMPEIVEEVPPIKPVEPPAPKPNVNILNSQEPF